MMKRITVAMLVSFVAAPSGAKGPPALRLPEKALAAEHYRYVTKVGELPEDIRLDIASQLEQRQLQMADAGAPFNSSDAVVDAALPAHRLIVAALGQTYSVVHFERGGVALTRWVVIFERGSVGLNTLWHGVITQTYKEPHELETAIRTGALWKAPSRSAQ